MLLWSLYKRNNSHDIGFDIVQQLFISESYFSSAVFLILGFLDVLKMQLAQTALEVVKTLDLSCSEGKERGDIHALGLLGSRVSFCICPWVIFYTS